MKCLRANIDKLYALYFYAFDFPGILKGTHYIITLGAVIPL